MTKRPSIPDVVERFDELRRSIYGRSAVGCCLHITLDDGNVRDSDLDFCMESAVEHDHEDCMEMVRLLRKMSRTQRLKLHARRSPPTMLVQQKVIEETRARDGTIVSRLVYFKPIAVEKGAPMPGTEFIEIEAEPKGATFMNVAPIRRDQED